MNKWKLAEKITNNVNKVLEDVDCGYKNNKFTFTVKQIKKYNERIIKAVLLSINEGKNK